jgi:membrane protease YdiL (CAAX protease family)
MKPESSEKMTGFRIPQIKEAGLVIILAFCIFPVTSFTGQINSSMHLPLSLSGVESWMVKQEDKADNLIDLLIVANTLPGMLLNLLMIALIPAVGEEMIFRGVFQKILSNLFKSGHIAIWCTSILFSAIHLQFFGFIPRLILGLVFGYLFFWSGTLWLPVISHFVNNAFPVLLSYVQGSDYMKSLPDIKLWQQAIFLPLPVILGSAILLYFRKNYKNQS